MKFRILSSFDAVNAESDMDFFSTVYECEHLRVDMTEVGDLVVQQTLRGGVIACLGNVIAMRDQSGFLLPLESKAGFLASAADDMRLADLANQLEGRFLLVYVDADGVCRVCADKFGKIEIFIQETESGVVLASDLSLLPEDPSLKGYDQAALAHMLTYYGYCPPKRHTIYKGVRRLGIGDTAVLNSGSLSIETTAFVPVETSEYGQREHHEYADLFLDHLKSAGSAEGNVVYLSSGWDSTAILAGLVHIFGARKVRCVTGRLRYSERSGVCNQFEVDRARKMAEYFGVHLDVVDFEYLDQGPDFFSSLCSVMRSNQMYSLNGLTHGKLAEFVKNSAVKSGEVVFAGEISDGAHNLGFSQYATIFHPSYGFREYSDKMASYMFGPTFFKLFEKNEHEKDPIYNLFRSRAANIQFDAATPDLEKRPLQLLTSFFLRNGRMPLWSLNNVNLLTSNGQEVYTKEMQENYLADAAQQAIPETIYSWYLHLYNSFHWQGSTVRTLPVLADVYGLKTDLPYWDGGIQEFLSGMPEEWGRGLDLNPTKFPLKWMLKNRIDYPYDLQTGPHAYTYDVDHSFNHYEEVFCHSKMTPVFQHALEGKPYHQILSSDVFNIEYIDGLVDDYVGNKPISHASLSDLAPVVLLCFIGWYGKN